MRMAGNQTQVKQTPSQMLARSRKSIYFYILEKSGELNPRHSGGKPKHCSLSYRTHADNSYINTATYNNYVILDLKITQKWLINVVFGHFISINVFRGDVGLVRVILK